MSLTAWTRPTLSWSLTCEYELGLTRKDAYHMFGLTLDDNFKPRLAKRAGLALLISMAALYGVALCGLFAKRFFYFGFFSSRAVLIVCLSIIIHHMFMTQPTIQHGLNQASNYRLSRENQCGDQYVLMDEHKLQTNLTEAMELYRAIIAFSWTTLAFTVGECIVGTVFVLPFAPLKVFVNAKDFLLTEWWQFLIVGYFKFN